MKKLYSAPGIMFQALSSGGLSAACSIQSTHAAYVCPVEMAEWEGETVFQEDTGCTWSPQDGGQVCYDVPTASSNVFES